MTFKRNAAGIQTNIATKAERRSGGAWVPFDIVKRRLSGAWAVVWSRIAITDRTVTATRLAAMATAGYRLNTSGVAEELVNAAYTTLETWLVMGSSASYEARATLNSGSLASGTTGTWLALSSSREWKVTDSVFDLNPVEAEILVEIRNATTLAVIDSATVALSAERTS